MMRIKKAYITTLIFTLIGVFLTSEVGALNLRIPIRGIDDRAKEIIYELARKAVANPSVEKEYYSEVEKYGILAPAIYESEKTRLEKEIFNTLLLVHEIRNLVTGILGLLDCYKTSNELSEEVRDGIRNIIKFYYDSREENGLKNENTRKRNPEELDVFQKKEQTKEDLALINKFAIKVEAFLKNDPSLKDTIEDYETIQTVASLILLILKNFDSKKGIVADEPTVISTKDLRNFTYGYFKIDAENRGFSLRVILSKDCPEEIFISPLAIWISLRNLIRNAADAIGDKIEQENPGRPLSLIVEFKKDKGNPNNIAIVVKDEGVGIQGDILENIFEPYVSTKVDVRRKRGLGLAIVKDIVGKRNGTIDVQSTPGKGTTFTVKLPVATPIQRVRHETEVFAQKMQPILNEVERLLKSLSPKERISKVTRETLQQLQVEVVKAVELRDNGLKMVDSGKVMRGDNLETLRENLIMLFSHYIGNEFGGTILSDVRMVLDSRRKLEPELIERMQEGLLMMKTIITRLLSLPDDRFGEAVYNYGKAIYGYPIGMFDSFEEIAEFQESIGFSHLSQKLSSNPKMTDL